MGQQAQHAQDFAEPLLRFVLQVSFVSHYTAGPGNSALNDLDAFS